MQYSYISGGTCTACPSGWTGSGSYCVPVCQSGTVCTAIAIACPVTNSVSPSAITNSISTTSTISRILTNTLITSGVACTTCPPGWTGSSDYCVPVCQSGTVCPAIAIVCPVTNSISPGAITNSISTTPSISTVTNSVSPGAITNSISTTSSTSKASTSTSINSEGACTTCPSGWTGSGSYCVPVCQSGTVCPAIAIVCPVTNSISPGAITNSISTTPSTSISPGPTNTATVKTTVLETTTIQPSGNSSPISNIIGKVVSWFRSIFKF